jgi:small subunit ribosomal protein S3Ae
MPKKLRGKEWYTLIAPKVFGEKEIGETPASEPKTLIGRKVDVHLINLINDLSKYYVKFYFKVNKIDGDKAYTQFDGMECLRDYISRLIRYGIKRVDTIQDLTTSDKVKLRVKTIIITSKKIRKMVEINLKKYVEGKIKKTVENNKLNDFIKNIVNDTLKNSVIREGSKIYPIRTFEIRKIERLSG